MKIKIEAVVYALLYEKLLDKFYSNFCLPTHDKTSRDIWDIDYPNKGKKIANDLFQLRNPNYFLRKYEEHAKQHIEVGYPLYPMTVDREQMVLALKYLLLGKDFELISNFSEFAIKDYQEWDWKKRYDTLLDLFINRFFPNGLSTSKDQHVVEYEPDNKDLERHFLHVVTSKHGVFESPTIKTLLTDFFSALSSKRYYDAWGLLSPEFQKESLWDGSLEIFERSFSAVKSISIEAIDNFSFDFQKAKVNIFYKERGVLFDLIFLSKKLNEIFTQEEFKDNEFVKHKINERRLDSFTKEIIRFHTLDYFVSNQVEKIKRVHPNNPYTVKLNWISEHQSLFMEKTSEELMAHNFQKVVLASDILPFSLFDSDIKSIEYDDRFACDVYCTFSRERWLIDNMLMYSIK